MRRQEEPLDRNVCLTPVSETQQEWGGSSSSEEEEPQTLVKFEESSVQLMGSPEQRLLFRGLDWHKWFLSGIPPCLVLGREQFGESRGLAWVSQRSWMEKLPINCTLRNRSIQMACPLGCHRGCMGCDLIWQAFFGCQLCTALLGIWRVVYSFIYLLIQPCIERY